MKAKILEQIAPIEGIRLGVAASGERYHDRNDLVVIELSEGTSSVGLFTKNVFCAAPVTISRQHLKARRPQYLVVNAGNANAGTGEAGVKDAIEICQSLASQVNCSIDSVLPFSTGVIGEPLATNLVCEALGDCLSNLSENNWTEAGMAIMTTDTRLKAVSAVIEIDGILTTVTGIAKGSGMIKPDMATMLAFVATDSNIPSHVLQLICKEVADLSFNRITVDGDTSTNDALFVMATGACGTKEIEPNTDEFYEIKAAIGLVCTELAKEIVRDGEGATKFVSITVFGHDEKERARVAYAVAESPLVKTALFASDANWGRILAAVGRSVSPSSRLDNIHIDVCGIPLVKNGEPVVMQGRDSIDRAFLERELDFSIYLNDSTLSTTVWTCDFSYDYVRINAEYRS